MSNLPYRGPQSVNRVQNDNVYDPVLYMLKRQEKQIRGTFAKDIGNIRHNDKEGAELIRSGHLLVEVDGDRFRHHTLIYGEHHRLLHYIVLHKETGRTERYDLIWGDHAKLIRYNYTLVSEGLDESQTPSDEDDDGFWLTGEYIDEDLWEV